MNVRGERIINGNRKKCERKEVKILSQLNNSAQVTNCFLYRREKEGLVYSWRKHFGLCSKGRILFLQMLWNNCFLINKLDIGDLISKEE